VTDLPPSSGGEPDTRPAERRHVTVALGAALVLAVFVAALLAWSGIVGDVAQRLVDANVVVELLAALVFVGPAIALAAVWISFRRTEDLRQRLTELARMDTLTGLPNRLHLAERLGAAVADTRGRNTGVAVLFVDLDRFKIVNDTFGHEVGDALMVAVAGRLREALRPDDQVVRYGGDEFVAICPEISNAGAAERIARRVIAALSEPYTIGRQNLNISSCVGISLTDYHGGPAEDVLRDADVAMYQAKAAGAGSYRTFDRTLGNSLTPSAIEARLREAVERQEFRVFYQPVVRTDDGVIVGVEALLRWDDPERGLLAPDEFLPILEETNLIIPVGTWVFREACRQAAEWRTAFPDHELELTVNVSARQLSQVDFGELIASALADTEVPHTSVCLEITESALMDDVSSAWTVLREAKTTGVRLALDDFGTGFSSLSYIRRFSLDMLKIDKSFVDGVGSEPDDNAIVEHVVGMARALGMVTVAEGVEQPAQLRELQRLGCDRAQGFWFSPPVPPNAIEALLEDSSLPARWSDVRVPEPVTPRTDLIASTPPPPPGWPEGVSAPARSAPLPAEPPRPVAPAVPSPEPASASASTAERVPPGEPAPGTPPPDTAPTLPGARPPTIVPRPGPDVRREPLPVLPPPSWERAEPAPLGVPAPTSNGHHAPDTGPEPAAEPATAAVALPETPVAPPPPPAAPALPSPVHNGDAPGPAPLVAREQPGSPAAQPPAVAAPPTAPRPLPGAVPTHAGGPATSPPATVPQAPPHVPVDVPPSPPVSPGEPAVVAPAVARADVPVEAPAPTEPAAPTPTAPTPVAGPVEAPPAPAAPRAPSAPPVGPVAPAARPAQLPTSAQVSGARWAGRGQPGSAARRLPLVAVPPPSAVAPPVAAPRPAELQRPSAAGRPPAAARPTAPPPPAPRRPPSRSAPAARPLVLPSSLPQLREVGRRSPDAAPEGPPAAPTGPDDADR
jgi:diguanylate cyclase (GGDEF)-like protein